MGAPADITSRTPLLSRLKRKPKEEHKSEGPDGTAVLSDLEHGDAVKAEKVGFGRIIRLAKPEAMMLLVATVALFVSSISNILIPTFAGKVIDIVTASAGVKDGKEKALHEVNSAILVIVGIVAVGSVATSIRSYLFSAASEHVVARLKKNLFSQLISQEIAFFDVTKTGELLNRLSEDTQVIKSAATLNLSETLRSLATAVIGIGFMFQTSWKLTALALVVVPGISLGIRAFGKYLRELSHKTQAASAVGASIAEESFGAVRTVRSFAQEKYETNRYGLRVDESLRLGLTQAALTDSEVILQSRWTTVQQYVSGFFSGGVSAAATLAIVAVVVYGAHLTINGKMTTGALTAFILYSLTVGLSLASLSGIYTTAIKAVGASQRVFQLLDRVSTMPSPGDKLPVAARAISFKKLLHVLVGEVASLDVKNRESSGAEVVIEDVWFAYPSRPKDLILKACACPLPDPDSFREVLQTSHSLKGTRRQSSVAWIYANGVNLELKPGAKVALVGPSGGGKTTIANLVERFYDPQKGVVRINGVSLIDIDHRHLHENVSIVSQEPTLFNSSIAENISYGLVGPIPQSEIERVARMANAHEFICKFPEGYQTQVGERGVRLSGGQKQRIAIARALLMDPKVLLLDEATSALDAESEYLVQDAMDRLMHGRTVLVIAHRLSTVQSADVVAVVSDGIIAERGSHEELLQKNGIYASLVRRQLQGPTRGSTSTASASGESD